MPTAIAIHEVDDVAFWLASPKREEVFKGVLEDIVTFMHPGNPNLVGPSGTIMDTAKFQGVMASETSAAAMKHDGVRPNTIQLLI